MMEHIEMTGSGSTETSIGMLSDVGSGGVVIAIIPEFVSTGAFSWKRSNIIEEKQTGFIEALQQEIMDVFGINLTDIAEACKVTRKTAYNWRNEERLVNRKKPGMDRLFLLSRAAKNWKSAGFPPIGKQFNLPLVHGKSLKELFSEESFDLEAIQFLGRRYRLSEMD